MHNAAHQLSNDPALSFQSAMADAGIICPDIPIADGVIHRFTVEGDKNGSSNGWYVFRNDSLPGGAFGSWRTDQKETWSLKNKELMTPAERLMWQQRMRQVTKDREKEQIRLHGEAREKAKGVWREANTDIAIHAYIKDKGIVPYGVRHLSEPARASGSRSSEASCAASEPADPHAWPAKPDRRSVCREASLPNRASPSSKAPGHIRNRRRDSR